ncbi:MAG: hypothetical protein ALECFALPRED_008146 [Alectoria fallacina]|uniref:Uncharacterized protein n=1 Tax=Alectoria fallacina TaxID=1903189 RepID=A0A8H3J2N0_9LECA|nr:MAG: hypothetical protein ALECFALPRED_008146 [Alectoria fallacina]
MTSSQNKLLPILTPLPVIGTKRKPTRRDLHDRRDPDDQRPLRRGGGGGLLLPLPDPDSELVLLRRAALNVEQAALKVRQSILDMEPVSAERVSLTILPEAADDDDDDDGGGGESVLSDDGEARAMEDGFIAKVSGVAVAEVLTARRRRRARENVQAFAKKVRAVKARRGSNVAAAAAAAPAFVDMQPGTTTRELTVAEAALALTNEQAGTRVTMGDLRGTREMEEDDKVRYRWTVVGRRRVEETRELTTAEAALVLTNMRAGTSVTMEDLRTARVMVDLWDNADTFRWTVGNVE